MDPPLKLEADSSLAIEIDKKDNAHEKKVMTVEQYLSVKNKCRSESSGDGATEYSSSFGEAGSVSDNDLAFNDDEVESFMYEKDPSSSLFFGFCEPGLIRPKRLTDHFKDFIRPLRRSCKWIELKLKRLQSHKRKYEKELASYEYRSHLMISNKSSIKERDTKSMPIRPKVAMKRKKRERIEETSDLASYTRDHYMLSHYEQKDHAYLRKAEGGTTVARIRSPRSPIIQEFSKGDGILSDVGNYLLSSLDHTESDKAMKSIFDEIEAAQFRVRQLETRVVKVVKNVAKSKKVAKSSSLNYNVDTLGSLPLKRIDSP